MIVRSTEIKVSPCFAPPGVPSNTPITIGVSTANAPSDTWFKIDNFRLYSLQADETMDMEKVMNEKQIANTSDQWYTLSGLRVKNPSHGLYVNNGRKVFLQ